MSFKFLCENALVLLEGHPTRECVESLLFVLELTGVRARVLGKVGGEITGTRDHISKHKV